MIHKLIRWLKATFWYYIVSLIATVFFIASTRFTCRDATCNDVTTFSLWLAPLCAVEWLVISKLRGWKHLNIRDAIALAREHNIIVAAPTIRLACAKNKIADARLDGKTWRFPRAAFLGWLLNHPHKRGRPRKNDNDARKN